MNNYLKLLSQYCEKAVEAAAFLTIPLSVIALTYILILTMEKFSYIVLDGLSKSKAVLIGLSAAFTSGYIFSFGGGTTFPIGISIVILSIIARYIWKRDTAALTSELGNARWLIVSYAIGFVFFAQFFVRSFDIS